MRRFGLVSKRTAIGLAAAALVMTSGPVLAQETDPAAPIDLDVEVEGGILQWNAAPVVGAAGGSFGPVSPVPGSGAYTVTGASVAAFGVADYRDAESDAGWSISLALSVFETSTDVALDADLNLAQLTLVRSESFGPGGTATLSGNFGAPTGHTFTLTGPPAEYADATVATAADGNGGGQSDIGTGASGTADIDLSLAVAREGLQSGQYDATLTFTLSTTGEFDPT